MYGMLVSTLPLDCKEAEDVFDIIIRGQLSEICIMIMRQVTCITSGCAI